MDDKNALVRRALEEHRGHRSGLNVSIPCPLPSCAGKKKANLSVHDSGKWKCWRCGEVGFLRERDRHTAVDRERFRRMDAKRAESAVEIFERCSDIYPNDEVDRYLRSRGILPFGSMWWPSDLRKGWLRHPTGIETMAMVAAVRNVAGTIVAIHRTFLTDEGKKIDRDPQKASLGHVRGGAVRLADGVERLCIGEGIETTLRAAMKLGDSVTPWSALTSVGMSQLELPRDTREIWVAPDMDPHGKNKEDNFLRNPEVAERRRAMGLPVSDPISEDMMFGSVGVESAMRLMAKAKSIGIETHLIPPMGKDHAE